VSFLLVKVGKKILNECPACGGLWVDNGTLQEICTDEEQQQAVMGFDPGSVTATSAGASPSGRTYIPCPECKKLMNRRQFADCSGVIVDWCKAHGTWFDRNELRQIVQFIQAGGLEKSREREKFKLQEERRNLETLSGLAPEADFAAPRNELHKDLFGVLGGIWRSLG
jgi:Zn-finger nucleic acid-binding protein